MDLHDYTHVRFCHNAVRRSTQSHLQHVRSHAALIQCFHYKGEHACFDGAFSLSLRHSIKSQIMISASKVCFMRIKRLRLCSCHHVMVYAEAWLWVNSRYCEAEVRRLIFLHRYLTLNYRWFLTWRNGAIIRTIAVKGMPGTILFIGVKKQVTASQISKTDVMHICFSSTNKTHIHFEQKQMFLSANWTVQRNGHIYCIEMTHTIKIIEAIVCPAWTWEIVPCRLSL